MVQMSVLAALHDHGRWRGKVHGLEARLARGVARFFDPKRAMLARYLPSAPKDKDRDLVDSWYLYHPLLNLGRMAQDGDEPAQDLFERSLGYATKAARHFGYQWPIQFRASDFEVVQQARDDDGHGQTDVGGLYAQVMLIAFELTGDAAHLAEARAAIDAGVGIRFELNYQANLTAWGAAACLRLWRITNEARYLDQSYAYLASFFHNSALWESDLEGARHYRTFLGVSALHDSPYMALFECYDSFTALRRYLGDSGAELDPAVRLLVSDYCRFALDRAWFYYPAALPPDLVCEQPRNGRIDRALAFPVEDLYIGGGRAGQVGQEIYGAGAALIFASSVFHYIEGAPFRLFCDHFLASSIRTSDRSFSFQLGGDPATMANLSILAAGAKVPKVTATSEPGIDHRGTRRRDRIDFRVPANSIIRLVW